MSGDDARCDSHAADHEGEYDHAHCATTVQRDLRTRHRRWDVRLCHILPCSFGANGVRRWCGRGRRPLAQLHAAVTQLCLLSRGPGDGLGPADGLGRRRFRTRRLTRRGCREEAASRVPRRWRRWGALCHPDRRALRPGTLCHHFQPRHLPALEPGDATCILARRRARGCSYHRLQLRPRGITWHRLAPEI